MPEPMPTPEKTDLSTRAVFRHFLTIRRGIIASTVLSVLAAIMEAVGLVLTVGLTNTLAAKEQRFQHSLGPIHLNLSRTAMIVAALIAIVLSAVITLMANRVRSRITISWTRGKRTALVREFLDTDWAIQVADRTGRLQAVSSYIDQAALVLSNLITAARGLAGVLVLLGTALIVSPTAAVAIVVLGVLLFAVLRPLTMRARTRSRDLSVLQRVFLEDLGEVSTLARDVRVFGVTERFKDRAGSSVDRLANAEHRVYGISWAVTPIYQSMALCLIVAILAIASLSKSLDLSTVGAVALLVLRSVAYGQQLQTSYNGFQSGAPAVELMKDELDDFASQKPEYGTTVRDRIDTIVLEDLSFTYPDETPGLRDVSLTMNRGEIIGIVGPSGAGKSTLAQILLGLRSPDQGQTLADGISFQEYARSSWTQLVSLVPQEPQLVDGTVRENIAFFRDGVTDDDVVAAAKASAIHTTIEALDEGYDTEIGRATRNLSGGQIQRIGIARALAGHPAVLVLDEPTSALDGHSEAAIQETLESLRGDVLVLIIAHRFTTLTVCSRIVVLEEGRVAVDGTIAEATEQSRFFRTALLGRGHEEVDTPGPDLLA